MFLLQTTQEQKITDNAAANRQAGEVSWRHLEVNASYRSKTVGKHYELFTMDRTSDNHLHRWRAFQLFFFLVFMATLDYKGCSLVRLAVGIPMVNWNMYDTSSHNQWMSIASIDRLVKDL